MKLSFRKFRKLLVDTDRFYRTITRKCLYWRTSPRCTQ